MYENGNKIRDEMYADPSTLQGRDEGNVFKFDLWYGFYVMIGGITLDVETMHDKKSRMTLTSRGVIALAEHRHFINVAPETVSDKSKASVVAKAFVCAQVLWMIVQRLACKIAGYPITLLEVHTMAHVGCALIMYILWWKASYNLPGGDKGFISTNQHVENTRHR